MSRNQVRPQNSPSSPLLLAAGLGLVAMLFSCTALSATSSAAPTPASTVRPDGPPEWWREHIDFLTRGDGCWRVENLEKSAEEPWDAYQIIYRPGLTGNDTTARLSGLADDRPEETFWHLHLYWDGGEASVVTRQFGRQGIVGKGSLVETDAGSLEQIQTYFLPDGRSWRDLHVMSEDGDVFVSTSSEWEEGAWQQGPTYRWTRCQGSAFDDDPEPASG